MRTTIYHMICYCYCFGQIYCYIETKKTASVWVNRK